MSKGAYIGAPISYKVLEYIESSGKQYIDTGFMPNQDTRVVADFQVVNSVASQSTIFGTRNAASPSASLGYVFELTSTTAARSVYFGGNIAWNAEYPAGTRILVDKNKNVCTVNGTNYTNTASSGQATLPLLLFCMNNLGTAAAFSQIKLYSCQIYDNGTLVRDYVPCEYNGEYGLYDKVNGKFYGNAGTGTFTAGTEIEVVTESVARKVKKGYIGIEGLARKIKKAYIGVDGVARLWWSSGVPITVEVKINKTGEIIPFKFDVPEGLSFAEIFDAGYILTQTVNGNKLTLYASGDNVYHEFIAAISGSQSGTTTDSSNATLKVSHVPYAGEVFNVTVRTSVVTQ